MFLSLFISSIIINEIAWMGTNISANDEWIELKNTTEENINLDNWKLIAEDGTPKIMLKGIIPANGFYLLERTDDDTVPGIPADLIYTGALSNSGEYLKLYDDSNNLIDEIDCSNGWTSGDNKTKETFKRTPKDKNDIPKDEVRPRSWDYPASVVFNKIMPSPEGADADNEWIEIKNNNNFEVDLSEWIIRDKQGNIKEYILKNTIPPLKTLTITRPESKITLNNSGDGLELLNPNKEIVDFVDFGKAAIGIAYIKTPSGWQWDIPETRELSEDKIQKIPETKLEKNEESKKNEEIKKGIVINLSEKNKKSGFSLFITGGLVAFLSATVFIVFKNKLTGY